MFKGGQSMTVREISEKTEKEFLSPVATLSSMSKGRKIYEL